MKRLLVFVGEGGVGKTSCAAATALGAAMLGRRVAVLTIDPAPRLGDALGIETIDGTPREVALPADVEGASLVAMKLDTEGTFDRVVESFATSAEAARTILGSPLYRTLSGSLGGSDSYMALQRLYELTQHEDYDLVVVDTPPAAHARALLSAPLRLTGLMETGAAAALKNPAIVLARAGSTVARAAVAVLLTVLERTTGVALRSQVSEFVSAFEDVLEGLTVRAEQVDALLREPSTGFIEVARPREDSIASALALRDSLAEMDLGSELVIVNRITAAPSRERREPLADRLAGAPDGTVEAVSRIEQELDELRRTEQAAIAALTSELESRRRASAPGTVTPLVLEAASLDHDVASIDDLLRLADLLARGEAKR